MAARALEKIEANVPPSDKEICGWVSFLMALQLRHPQDIAILRSIYEEKWRAEMATLQPLLSKKQGLADTLDVNSFIDQQWPGSREEAMFELLASLMNHQDIGKIILDFTHRVVTLNSKISLITSDRPMLMSPTIGEKDAYIILPLGPQKLYVGGKTQNTVRRILTKPTGELAQIVNDLVAQHATIAVYSNNHGLDEYVRKRLGNLNYDSIFTRLSRTLTIQHQQPITE